MSAEFNHYDLKMIKPHFDSSITDLIIELDHLRKKRLRGTTRPKIFFQLKDIFHTLESIGSARIEGNRTTIAEYIETKLDSKNTKDEKIIEIKNMEKAMDFIDNNINNTVINRIFLSELHKVVVKNLSSTKEGDYTPGIYRTKNLVIANSRHRPPDFTQVTNYMDRFFEFINDNSASKYDLLKTAIAHHRFVWIHPFGNGNGRTVRLFTYAMLVKQGFNVNQGRIVNPTAVFCNNRNKYYDLLSRADSGTEEGILEWCEYVLTGLRKEIDKIDKLLNYDYLSSAILHPAVLFSRERQVITETETKILKVAVDKQVFQASDIRKLFPGKLPAEISRMLRKLKERKMIVAEKKDSRKYTICFYNNFLLRGIIIMLDKNGFLPIK
jgi:Fic family protein